MFNIPEITRTVFFILMSNINTEASDVYLYDLLHRVAAT